MSHAKLPHDLSARIESTSHDSPKSRSQSGPGNRELLSQLGGAKAMPEQVQSKMEEVLGSDFSGVRLYESPLVSQHGAQAAAAGNAVAFAPGKLDLSSRSGLELLGHELSHVASQARGEVSGSGFVHHAALEHKADADGAKTAAAFDSLSGQTLTPMSAGMSMPSASAPVQAKKKEEESEKDQLMRAIHEQNLSGRVESMRRLATLDAIDPNMASHERDAFRELSLELMNSDEESRNQFVREFVYQQADAAKGLVGWRNTVSDPGEGSLMAKYSLFGEDYQSFSTLINAFTGFDAAGGEDFYLNFIDHEKGLKERNPESQRALDQAREIMLFNHKDNRWYQEHQDTADSYIANSSDKGLAYARGWKRPQAKKKGFFSRLFGR